LEKIMTIVRESGVCGKLAREENMKSRISRHCPFIQKKLLFPVSPFKRNVDKIYFALGLLCVSLEEREGEGTHQTSKSFKN
jgi:hypothetical protein